MANCNNCIKQDDCCSAGKMVGYCGGYNPAQMTNQEAILSGKIPLEHIVCGFNRLCGRCQTDRKTCNAELNCGCGRQWLRAKYKADFTCDYKKLGLNRAKDIVSAMRKSEWIPVAERLPEEGINPVTQDAYVYPVTIDLGNVKDVRYYSFCRGHWYSCGPNPLDDLVVAWLPRPEPYNQQ